MSLDVNEFVYNFIYHVKVRWIIVDNIWKGQNIVNNKQKESFIYFEIGHSIIHMLTKNRMLTYRHL